MNYHLLNIIVKKNIKKKLIKILKILILLGEDLHENKCVEKILDNFNI